MGAWGANPARSNGAAPTALRLMMPCGSSPRVLTTSALSDTSDVLPPIWFGWLLISELEISPHLLAQLSKISVSTVKRILKRIRQDEPLLPRRRSSRGNKVTRDVPRKRIAWNEQQPGHFEVDLVHHCGLSASGEYLHAIQMIDVATGGSERVAVQGRSYLVRQRM